MKSISVQGPWRFRGSFIPPGDKSISHRAVMFGALSDGLSSYSHLLESDDVMRTVQAFRSMGISIDLQEGSGKISIRGKGLQGLIKPKQDIYLGNSGTSIRLLLGILAGQRFETVLTGDASLSNRPMKRVTQPLKKMGAQIKGRDDGNYAPLTIRGGRLRGIHFENKIASAQVKSAILLAGLYAEGQTRVQESIPSRDHTERFLMSSGAKLRREDAAWVMEQTDRLKPFGGTIPGDISSAAFFIAGAAMTPGSELTVENLGLNPTRTGLLDVLKRMGATLEIDQTTAEPEPVGKVHIQGALLKGVRIERREIPSLVDELPILMTVMSLAQGESLISGAEELRVKETDRIHSMVTNLTNLGAQIQELPDGCVIRGVEALRPGKIKSYDDHRTAMSLAVAAAAIRGTVEIDDCSNIATSFPDFFKVLESIKEKVHT